MRWWKQQPGSGSLGAVALRQFANFCLVVGLYPGSLLLASDPVPNPQQQAAEYARLLSQIQWTPVADTLPNRKGGYFPKGKTVTGVPYSSVQSVGRYIGFDISLRTFLAAVENPRSVLYTETLAGKVPNAAPFYGSVCSAFTSYALQCSLPEVSRRHGPESRGGVREVAVRVADDVRVGDIIFTPPRPGSHVEMVTEVKRNEAGSVTRIRVEESRPPTTTTKDYTPKQFQTHLAGRDRQLLRIANLDDWRGGNRAERSRFPDYVTDARVPSINRSLLLDLGDWVPYQLGQPVKFHIMDRDALGLESLVIQRDGITIQRIPLAETGVIQRKLPQCGDYTAHVVHTDGTASRECEFAVCDLALQLPPQAIEVGQDWTIEFTAQNIEVLAVFLVHNADSYVRYPLFLSEQQAKDRRMTIPGDLIQTAGKVQVWLIGEHELGRLKIRQDVEFVAATVR